ncbi:terpenoid synthase [Calocera cornea HHB12733]|uniref:Bifunctional lycopene cyclase/phytoene synthase n=1 Tax=Calocera cornea HHB12733 TaxID=1353952 RepID=A0A165EMW8_9BASI|nr:terpenoid synthase [Calocera cornea HHB12733]
MAERMITYLEIHLYFTLPPCLLLYLVHRPLLQPRDTFRFLLLAFIATAATIPWDSYLIRSGVWGYPEGVVWGTLFDIPVEEISFFVIQTYITTQLYALLNKPVFHPSHLPPLPTRGVLGGTLLLLLSLLGGALVYLGGPATYTGLIFVWACPVLSLLWYVSGPHALRLPLLPALGPVVIPTLYLWAVDTYALRQGTWEIGDGTKFGVQLWRGLEFEEALFFFVSNALLTMGSIAFSHAFALVDVLALVRREERWDAPSNPIRAPCSTVYLLYRALTLPAGDYPSATISDLKDAAQTLEKHSKSFHIASSAFGERCRLLLLSYYAFCRVTDNLVDEADDTTQALESVQMIDRFLKMCYLEAAERSTDGGPDGSVEDINQALINGNGHATNGNGHAINGNGCLPQDKEQFEPMLASRDSGYADCLISTTPLDADKVDVDHFITTIRPHLRPAFNLFRLLAPLLPPQPVLDLLCGYAFDALEFPPCVARTDASPWLTVKPESYSKLTEKQEQPIRTEQDLILYCRRVAGSVGVACTYLMHAASSPSPGSVQPPPEEVIQKASDMGVALQLVNIARDLVDDASLGRSYVPSAWATAGTDGETDPEGILADPKGAVERFRPRLLKLAFRFYQGAVPALAQLPEETRLGARAAVACYMAMGVLMRTGWFERKGRWTTAVKMAVLGLVLYVPTWGRGHKLQKTRVGQLSIN